MLKKITTTSVIWSLLVLNLATQSVHAQSDVLDRILVTVNGSPITESEIEQRSNFLIFLTSDGNQSSLTLDAARRQATDDAIVFRLLQQRANEIGIGLTSEEIDERIALEFESRNFSESVFLKDLTEHGFSIDVFRRTISETLLRDKLVQQIVAPRIFIRDEEIDRYISINQESFQSVDEFNLSVIVASESLSMNFDQKQLLRRIVRDIEYEIDKGSDFYQIAVAASQFEGIQAGDLGWVRTGDLDPVLAQRITPSKVNQIIGPIVSGSNIFFARINDHQTSIGPELPLVKELHLARIILQASNQAGTEVNAEQLENLRRTILNGGDFGEIAKVYSHDSSTKQQGGDMGWIPEDSVPFQYLRPLADMEIGDVSPVQQIENIVFIIQFRGIRDASQQQRMRSLVRSRLRNIKLRNEVSNWIDELRETAVIDYRSVF